jgi:hypothetical protein
VSVFSRFLRTPNKLKNFSEFYIPARQAVCLANMCGNNEVKVADLWWALEFIERREDCRWAAGCQVSRNGVQIPRAT